MRINKFSGKILNIAVVIIVFGGIGYLSYFNHNEFEKAMIKETERDLSSIAKSEAQSLAGYIGDIHDALAALSMDYPPQQDILEGYDQDSRRRFALPHSRWRSDGP